MAVVIFFIILSVSCFGYYAFAASYAGIHSAFLWFWLMAGSVFFALSALSYMCVKHDWLKVIPKAVKYFAVVVISLGIILFVVLEGMVISGMNSKPDMDADYVIVLGAQVRGTRVTKSLAKRLNAAYEYSNDNKDCKIIVSGGQGVSEDISEALAMKNYLVDKGVDEDRVIMEDKSTTTKENLLFSKDIIADEDAKVVIVTNNFHVYRAKKLAKKLGYKNVSGMAAKSDNRLILNYMVREGLAIFKEMLMGNI